MLLKAHYIYIDICIWKGGRKRKKEFNYVKFRNKIIIKKNNIRLIVTTYILIKATQFYCIG